MGHYYLADYIGTGAVNDPFRPRGSDQPGWSAIDLRANPASALGPCLLMLPVRADPIGALYLGDAPTATIGLVGARLGNRLGLTLTADRLDLVMAELLVIWGRDDGTRWRPLRPTRDGRLELWLGDLLWQRGILAGGSSLSESFNTTNGSPLGPDLTWTNTNGVWDVQTNQATLETTGGSNLQSARAESDLASADHYAQAIVTNLVASDSTVVGGTAARFDPAALTYYTAHIYRLSGDSGTCRTQKEVSGTDTTLGSTTGVTWAPTDTIKIECNGSTITRYYNGSSQGSLTDSSIAGNKRTGIVGYETSAVKDVQLDAFTAADLATPTTDIPTYMRHYRQNFHH